MSIPQLHAEAHVADVVQVRVLKLAQQFVYVFVKAAVRPAHKINPGRDSTYRSGKSVQTTGTASGIAWTTRAIDHSVLERQRLCFSRLPQFFMLHHCLR